jgi:hypothetical protein
VIRYQQGRLAELVGPLRDSEERSSAYRGGLALSALACVETGHCDEGLRLTRHVLGPDAPELPRDVFWLAFMCLFAGVAATTGDRDLVATISEALASCADHSVVFGAGGAVMGSGHSWLGKLAVAQGDLDRACEHLREAICIADRIAAPYWGAQARLDLAAALAQRGSSPDANGQARDLARGAIEVATAGGYERLLHQAEAGFGGGLTAS